MTWEQKLQALKVLGEAALHMRQPGDWHVTVKGVEIGGNGLLESAGGNGGTPEQAVDDAFMRLTRLPQGRHIVCRAYGPDRMAYRWEGFMWVPVKEEGVTT